MSAFTKEFLDLVNPKDRNNITVFDIGAYNGDDSLIFQYNFGCKTVVAFEPSFKNYSLMESRLRNTPILKYNKAISDTNGKQMFYDTDGEVKCAGSLLKPTEKLLKQHDAFKHNQTKFNENGYLVETIRLDTFIEETNLVPNVLHIDVQGAEYYAISSLGKYRPDIIFLETSETEHYESSKSTKELNNFLHKMGYELHTTLQWDSLYILKR